MAVFLSKCPDFYLLIYLFAYGWILYCRDPQYLVIIIHFQLSLLGRPLEITHCVRGAQTHKNRAQTDNIAPFSTSSYDC